MKASPTCSQGSWGLRHRFSSYLLHSPGGLGHAGPQGHDPLLKPRVVISALPQRPQQAACRCTEPFREAGLVFLQPKLDPDPPPPFPGSLTQDPGNLVRNEDLGLCPRPYKFPEDGFRDSAARSPPQGSPHVPMPGSPSSLMAAAQPRGSVPGPDCKDTVASSSLKARCHPSVP